MITRRRVSVTLYVRCLFCLVMQLRATQASFVQPLYLSSCRQTTWFVLFYVHSSFDRELSRMPHCALDMYGVSGIESNYSQRLSFNFKSIAEQLQYSASMAIHIPPQTPRLCVLCMLLSYSTNPRTKSLTLNRWLVLSWNLCRSYGCHNEGPSWFYLDSPGPYWKGTSKMVT
jgi:hypothetical protein